MKRTSCLRVHRWTNMSNSPHWWHVIVTLDNKCSHSPSIWVIFSAASILPNIISWFIFNIQIIVTNGQLTDEHAYFQCKWQRSICMLWYNKSNVVHWREEVFQALVMFLIIRKFENIHLKELSFREIWKCNLTYKIWGKGLLDGRIIINVKCTTLC